MLIKGFDSTTSENTATEITTDKQTDRTAAIKERNDHSIAQIKTQFKKNEDATEITTEQQTDRAAAIKERNDHVMNQVRSQMEKNESAMEKIRAQMEKNRR
ncbi:MAG: hypothetical protein WCI27_01515 [Candidatus Omnitrophota bacterium]